jgi:hypothetical protein
VALPSDLIELLREFDDARVRYLLIGGHALGFHAVPRFTKDVDFWIASTPEDLSRLERALRAFAAPESTILAVRTPEGLDVAWMGNPPLRFYFMKEVPGGSFEEAFRRRVRTRWEGVPVTIVSLQDLVQLKRASGRPQDLLDAETLESVPASQESSSDEE